VLLVLLASRLPPWPIVLSDLLDLAASEDESGRPLGVCCREDHREWRPFADTHEDGALGADRVHDGADVVHPLLERAHGCVVREAHAALVEEDQAREAREPLHEAAVARFFPVGLEVREPAHDEDEVDVARPKHLVGDVDVA
jgi:hypothetical protein